MCAESRPYKKRSDDAANQDVRVLEAGRRLVEMVISGVVVPAGGSMYALSRQHREGHGVADRVYASHLIRNQRLTIVYIVSQVKTLLWPCFLVCRCGWCVTAAAKRYHEGVYWAYSDDASRFKIEFAGMGHAIVLVDIAHVVG